MNAPADKNVSPTSFVAVRVPDTRPFPLSFLFSFPATSAGATYRYLRNNSRDVGSGKPRLILAVYPNPEPLSALQCGVKARVGPASPRPRKPPSPGVAGEVLDERGECGAPRLCCPPWAPGPWVGRITRPLLPSRGFRGGLKARQ